jgi:hypothetical protein
MRFFSARNAGEPRIGILLGALYGSRWRKSTTLSDRDQSQFGIEPIDVTRIAGNHNLPLSLSIDHHVSVDDIGGCGFRQQ